MPYDTAKKDPRYGRHDEDYSDLVQALQAEERDANDYLESEVSAAQIDALRRYFGELHGDEVEGRAQIVTREVFEAIEWLRPDLTRLFTAGGRIVEFEGTTQESDQYADEASDYVNYVFFQDNDGIKVVDEYIFDGLLQRLGVIACEWKDAEFSPAQEVKGLGMAQMQMLMQDATTHIEDWSVRQGEADEAHPDGAWYDLKIRRVSKEARADVFTIAPEDMRVSARAVDLETATYAGDVIRMMKGEAARLWPDYAEEIDGHSGRTNTWNSDERRAERFRDLEGGSDITTSRGTGKAEQIELLREYIRFDKDGDGYPEMLRVFRLGDCILECNEVDEHIYAGWTPTPVPHRLYGLSINDQIRDLQLCKTVLLRGVLDSVYQSVVPRIAVDTNNVNLDDLLSVVPGAVIRVQGAPGDKLMPIQAPDLSGSGVQAMQWIDQVIEVRSGVTRHAQGLDPDALNHTARGIELMQNAANARKEQYARNAAMGLQCFFRKLYRLLVSHQNEARAVKIAGQWRNIDPRKWAADVRCTVSTGLGTGAKDAQLAMLQMIQADQVAAVQAWGINPVVTPEKMLAVVEEKMRVMGYKSRDRFFGDPTNPDGSPWVPEPPPDPNVQKVQAQVQESQARLQMDMQKTQADTQLRAAVAQTDAQMQMQKDQTQVAALRERAALELQLTRERAAAEIELQREKAEAEMRLKAAQLDFEAQLAERKMLAEIELAEKRQSAEERLMHRREGVSGDANFGGQVG